MTAIGSVIDRRRFLAAGASLAATGGFPRVARAQAGRLKIGLMLPSSGALAPQGAAIENGFRLALQELRGRLGGRKVEFVKIDDESDAARAGDHVQRLVAQDKVDLLLGTVHYGTALAMVRATRELGVPHILPGAGFGAAAGSLCAPNVFRTSYSNWQSGHAMGLVMAARGVKTMITIGWRSLAGEECVKGFRDAYLKGGGGIARELWLALPGAEFHAPLAAIAALKPDAVFAYFTGAGAAGFLKSFRLAGLGEEIALVGPGQLTEGVETALHYGDGLETPKNIAFRRAYRQAYRRLPDMHAVAGYDAGLLLEAGLRAVGGDAGRRAELFRAMERARIDSPRGQMRLSRTHNPIHSQYLRKVVGRENRITGIAARALDDDPAMLAACRMA